VGDPGSVPGGKAFQGDGFAIYFDAARCRHFGECVRRLPEVFDAKARPWINPEHAPPAAVAEVIARCPSGALHFVGAEGDPEIGEVPTTMTLVEGGPVLVRGQLVIETPNGALHETRAALCRCGASTNVPFCDGACQPAAT
jgi:uncharacterized Fe-S cluster protein YjdI